MIDKSPARLKLPRGLPSAEETRWWDEHPEYWETAAPENVPTGAGEVRRTKPVNLRLPVDMIDTLKQEAARRGIPYQTLVMTWLKDRLEAEGRASSSTS